jgi:hypothetical protein
LHACKSSTPEATKRAPIPRERVNIAGIFA